MPEIRYIKEFTNGKLTAEIPYEVSDEELEREEIENTIDQLSVLPDSELTTDQLKQMVKALARLRR
jgi:hypothetical protein